MVESRGQCSRKEQEMTEEPKCVNATLRESFFGPDICPRYETEECPANGGSACPTDDELADAEDNAWQIWEVCDS